MNPDSGLWTCPECGRSFANRNQWHSCTDIGVEAHLAGKSPEAAALYRTFEHAVRDCGEFRIHAQKTRIAFIARMTFAGARLARRWIDVSFITPKPIDDARIRRVELYGPTSFGSTIRITEPDGFDADVRGWLCEAHRRGTQESRAPDTLPDPVVGHTARVLTVPLRARVERRGDELTIALPRYAWAALAAHSRLSVRIPPSRYPATLRSDGSVRFDEPVLESRGLGDGDTTDAFIAPVA